MKNQKGFSLVELLVVVIIIAIIAAIAIPNLLASRRAANEASAISSLRTIHSAQATYFGTTGLNSQYATTLAVLGTQGLIDGTLALGTKSGYVFAGGAGTTSTNQYCVNARPSTIGITGTGNRDFGVGTTGVIYGIVSTTQGTSLITCDAATGAIGGGTAIQ